MNEIDHQAKHDEGKLQLRLVPPQIIRDIAEVRMYGNAKYGDPDNWKTVEKWRYIDALYRHFLVNIIRLFDFDKLVNKEEVLMDKLNMMYEDLARRSAEEDKDEKE